MTNIEKMVIDNKEYVIADAEARSLVTSLQTKVKSLEEELQKPATGGHEVIEGKDYNGTSELDSSKVYFITSKADGGYEGPGLNE